MPFRKRLLAIIVSIFLGSSVVIADQAMSGSLMLTRREARALEATANTPQEHLRLALYYHELARKFDERVRYHEEMGEFYKKNPPPSGGKQAVPIERHCREWAWRFAGQAERAAVLAAFHEEKALGSTPTASALAQSSRSGLRATGFGGENQGALTIQATPEQSSLFRDSVTASVHFYELVRNIAYVMSRNSQPPIETAELRKSAVTLFNAQERFAGTLSDAQKTAMEAPFCTIQKLRRDLENRLSQLEKQAGHHTDKSYFGAAKRMQENLERWGAEQQEIAFQLGIPPWR